MQKLYYFQNSFVHVKLSFFTLGQSRLGHNHFNINVYRARDLHDTVKRTVLKNIFRSYDLKPNIDTTVMASNPMYVYLMYEPKDSNGLLFGDSENNTMFVIHLEHFFDVGKLMILKLKYNINISFEEAFNVLCINADGYSICDCIIV